MGCGVQFPAHQGGAPKNVWDFGGYGLWQAMRELIVLCPISTLAPPLSWHIFECEPFH